MSTDVTNRTENKRERKAVKSSAQDDEICAIQKGIISFKCISEIVMKTDRPTI